MKKINNVSDVFREAKEYLWDGGTKGQTAFICFAIGYCPNYSVYHEKAVDIVQERLGEHGSISRYLRQGLKVKSKELTHLNVQTFRRDWLTALEKEFAPKLKPKKGFYIHHFDGDKTNNELSNLTYVPIFTKSDI